jgi:hypothetical protein
VTVWLTRMFCHIGLQATTTEISSFMICQSYWKMYHWQSEYECGTCMMVLLHILAVLCELFSVSRYSDWLRTCRLKGRNSSPGGVKNLDFLMSSRPKIERPGHEADHSPPTSAEVKKTLVYIFTLPYVFVA